MVCKWKPDRVPYLQYQLGAEGPTFASTYPHEKTRETQAEERAYIILLRVLRRNELTTSPRSDLVISSMEAAGLNFDSDFS
jgi:hypothetical protein